MEMQILLDIDVNDLAPDEIYSVKEDLKNKTIYSDLKINISKFTTPGSSGQPVAISPSTDNIEITFEMEDLIIREGEINTSEIDKKLNVSNQNKWLRIFPNSLNYKGGNDGFFIARIKKIT